MLDAFKLIAILVASILWGAWLVLVLREKDVHPFRDTLEGFGRLGWMKKVGVLFVVAQLTMFGGAKHGGTNDVDEVGGTNDVEIVEGGETNEVGEAESGEAESFPLQGNELRGPFLSGRPSQSLTSGRDSASPLTSGEDAVSPLPITDILRGYRLESVATNDEISYALPSDGEVRTTWHLTGACEDVQRIGLESLEGLGSAPFKFPLGNNLCSSLWAYTWGKVRPQLKNATNEIAAVGAPMSAIPAVSRFWTMATTNDTYLLTWENFTFGRIRGEAESFPLQNGIVPPLTSGEDTASPLTSGETPLPLVSAQIELFRNGDFITRSNNVESVYRRVIEPNPIGPVNPPDPENPAMPIRPYGPVQDLSVINETNAYCWVDIVVNNADAWVRFEGDGPSNLADPSFAAKAGETNHVVILIGKTYKVTCNMDFSVIAKSDPAIEERWEDDHTLWLNWPVLIEAWEGNGNSFRMHVVPGCLGGTFAWTESDCPLSGSGMFFSYSCDTNSLCSGCAARGHYDYEGYAIDCIGGWCGCNCALVEPEVPEAEPDDGPYAGGVSVSFSDAAVIFEDGYANMPGEFVPRRSTRTTLSCVAHGGPNGGTATFSISGDDKLVRASGRSLPVTVTVPPEQRVAFEIVYEGKEPSGSERDIVATATFTEEDSQPSSSDAFLTSVKVELETIYAATSNPDKHRHVYGIGEGVRYRTIPASVQSEWSFVAGTNAVATYDWGGNTGNVFICPWTTDGLSGGCFSGAVTIHGCELNFSLLVVEPNVIALYPSTNIESSRVNPVYGEAGHLLMYLQMFVDPQYVSFKGIKIVEIPDESQSGVHWGYYNDRQKGGNWSHTANDGAGIWNEVGETGFYGVDRAGHSVSYSPPWMNGIKVWQIPMGWGPGGDSVAGQFDPNPTTQTFSLTEDGTFTIRKFNHEATRNIHGSIWCE